MIVHEENILLNLEGDNYFEVLKTLSDLMAENGYVEYDYYASLIKREEEFPTGLPTEGVKVAIPHADSNAVLKTGVAIGVLKKPVLFRNMTNYNEKVYVEIIFLIANRVKEKQPEYLKKFMQIFSNPDLLNDMKVAKSEKEIVNLMNKTL